MKTVLILAAFAALIPAAAQDAPDGEGFIRNWLVLAPIPVAEGSGATEIDVEQVKGEASLKPKEGDKSTAGSKEMTWKAHKTADFFIDFRESFGSESPENVAGYAIAYVVADDEMKGLKLQVGSNDQCKVYLNGKQVIKFDETRTLEKDQNSADVTLAKGQNVVILKVINEMNNWQGCLRFTKDGTGVKNLKVSLKPQ